MPRFSVRVRLPARALYGTTNGVPFQGGGTVFSLRPPVTICRSVLCPWTETVLYGVGQFGGIESAYGQVAFDSAGNIYGTTAFGGVEGYGDVYELSRAGNSWTGKRTGLRSRHPTRPRTIPASADSPPQRRIRIRRGSWKGKPLTAWA